jgi:MYXO-CTERM domain-containing protein
MGSTEGSRWLGAVACGLLIWGMAGPAALAETGSGQALYGCDQAVRHGAGDGLVKTTDPPAGSRVEPGQEIRVELSWRPEEWTGEELHKVLDCVTLDGKLSSVLSGGEKPTANDGRFSHRYRVPADAAPGTAVCDRGFLSGPSREEDFARAKSDRVCFTVEEPQGHRAGEVGPPAVPPAPQPAPPPAVGGEQLIGAGSLSPSPPPAPVTAPVVSPRVPEAATQLPRTGGGPPPGAGLACLALAALVRRRRR